MGCTQRECTSNQKIVDEYENLISTGTIKTLLGVEKPHEVVTEWS